MSEAIEQDDLVKVNMPGSTDTCMTRDAGEGRLGHTRVDSSISQTSDTEYEKALEVILENDKSNRRKASITEEEAAEIVRRKSAQRSDIACRVHALLADQQKLDKAETLSGIQDIKHDRRPDKKGDDGQTVRSRLLTKKQLSDMAWGVRELSKRLGAVKLRVKVKNIFLLTKAHDESLIELTRDMCKWLLSEERDSMYTVYVEDTLKDNKKFDVEGIISKNEKVKKHLKFWDNHLAHEKPQLFDFVISLGGDGTVLYASWLFQRIVPPVMSFALGSLGFLTKFDFEQYPELLTTAFRDGVVVSLRLRFEGTVMRSVARDDQSGPNRDLVEELVGAHRDDIKTHKSDRTFEILNDIVVDRGPNPTMSSIEIFGDDEHFTTVQADGVCVATPTGSTAYNLAAGGSLCHPDNPVILVTAICAHTLSFRPIILPDTMVLRVGVPYDARTSSWASFDGRERVELHPGDYVTVSASRYPFANVMPQGRRSEDWVNSISRTLQWNVRSRQKSFKEWEKS